MATEMIGLDLASGRRGDRLDSWKQIACYLGRDLRTVRRWEAEKGLPVHRVPGGQHRSVFAYRAEIDAWLETRNQLGNNGDSASYPYDQHSDANAHPQMEASDQTFPVTGGASLPPHNGSDIQEQPPKTPLKGVLKSIEHLAEHTLPSFTRRERLLAVALAGCLVIVAFLGSAFLVRARTTTARDPIASRAPVLPLGIEHWLAISIVNQQEDGIERPFQQLVVLDSSKYARVEADNLQNVEFFDEQGTILNSWLESGNSKFANRTAYWVLLPKGTPSHKVVHIYMGFGLRDQNFLNTSHTGEAAGLSPTYAEYDNGASVFLKYADFSSDSLPPGWYAGSTPGGQGEVQLRNGVRLSHSGRGGGSAFIGSDWKVGSNFAEMHLLSEQTVNGQDMVLVCSENPKEFRWTPASVGYQNMSRLEIEDNLGGNPSVLAAARAHPAETDVIGIQDGALYAGYEEVARIGHRICGGDYLASAVNTGSLASFSFDWIRLRTPPPSGVMPTVIVGKLH